MTGSQSNNRSPPYAFWYFCCAVPRTRKPSRKSPVGGPHPVSVDAATAKFLQEVAWETVQEYYGAR